MLHWQRPLLCHSMRTVLTWQRKLIKKRTAEDGISDEGCWELSEPDKAEPCSSNRTLQFYFYWTDWTAITAKTSQASTYMHAHISTDLFQLCYITLEQSKQYDVGCRSPRETSPLFAAEKRRVCSPAAWWPEQHDLMSDITLEESQGIAISGQLLNFAASLLGSLGFHSPAQLVCNSHQMPKETVREENHRDQ